MGESLTNESNSTNMTEFMRRAVPKLGGSAAGFIILIVALCVIILVSLTAIYFLLREDRTSDEEAQKHNQRPRTTTYVTPPEDDTGSQPNSWLHRTYERLAFTRTNSTDRIPEIKVPQNQNERADISTPPRNEWHAESADDLHLKAPEPGQIKRHSQIDRVNTSIVRDSSIRRLSTPTSTYSVRFDLNGNREIPPFERDRFAPSPMATLPSIQATQISSPTSSPGSSPASGPTRLSRGISHDRVIPPLSLTSSARYEQDIAQYSAVDTSSSPSLTTFQGGTKFLETF
ncbi:hypothetical protein P691DRAFT_719086 [Macrolepiota fuliginosa MF-IS2]|uniref:Uncharacterized protein n=1 Tax=Macrolepiota fuliginosa MF-IS2 TaxID=1400762 RepID=A0A9P6C6I8_9AGAR|nr:hypothetical protein P691DRAFT_719086 [Macrolepiota fuliginosa MF-IS2]